MMIALVLAASVPSPPVAPLRVEGAVPVAAPLRVEGAVPVAAPLRVDRVVMLMRHGIRAPLDGEVPAATRTAAPWPRWPVAQSRLTGRGAAALAVLGRADRRRYAALFGRGCPEAGSVRIRANTAVRTIASAAAWANGFAPGCPIAVGHRGADEVDPLFEPLRAGATDFDAVRAVAEIERFTGGVDALASRHRDAGRLLDRILGCGDPQGCTPSGPSRLVPSRDGRSVDLSGPIRDQSGTAQVLLLQYAQGLPRRDIGWGRADAAAIARVGTLHAALFDVFSRSPYMAAHQSAVFGRAMLDALAAADGARIDVLMGHDTNVTALAALLKIDLVASGYAVGDAAPGGALVLERLRDARGDRYVRLSYRVQPLAATRGLGDAVEQRDLPIPGCAAPCALGRFDALVRGRLAPLR